jgi:hypothetical protein
MSRHPASITQADIRRVIRAAKLEGVHSIELRVGETIVVIRLQAPAGEEDHLRLALHEAPVL